MLAYEVPMQYHAGAVYLMNQRVFAQLGSMSDAIGRPLFGPLPSGRPGLQFAGFPIVIANQLPDVVPGACPVIFGNFKEAYTVVTRIGLTMRPDPYTAGFCTLFRFEARVGGNTTCPNAARFLRIH
jgi:HK97 family phage major capsid protein